MNIGISGANGQLGSAVLDDLKKGTAAHALIAISRSPKQPVSVPRSGDAAAAAELASLEWRIGDYDRPGTLPAAYAGLDRLLLIPSPELLPGRRAEQLNTAIDAAMKAGVGHIVLVSSTTAYETETPSNASTYWSSERHLIHHAPSWSILRMNYFAETFAQEAQIAAHTGVLNGLAENKAAFVSRDDLAAAAAGLLAGSVRRSAFYAITGDRSLTGAQRAEAVSRASGRPVTFAIVPEADMIAGFQAAGLPDIATNAILDIQRDFANGLFDIVTGDVERLSGRRPRSLASVLEEAFTSDTDMP
ncbi:NAD(P)H-binding protein [Saccharibacillus sacchari]|uniref:NAD(P)H-binding protein n=1 Tax=Saccharibacillus sacchari TaxID=456493 RepID=A0ACC6PHT7_9BACL